MAEPIEPSAGRNTVAQRVVAEIFHGRGDDDVAVRLALSRHTVEADPTRAYQKLGVRNRVDLIARITNVA